MKKLTVIMVLGLSVIIAAPVMAQPMMGQRMSVDERIAEMDEVLDLTDAQEKQLRTMFEEQENAIAQRQSSRARGGNPSANAGANPRAQGGNPGAMGGPGGMMGGPGMMGGRGGFGRNQDFNGILTAEQAEKYAAFQQEQRLDQQVDRLVEQLGLNDTQSKQVRGILAEQNAKTQEMMQSMAGGGGDPQSMMENMRTARENSNAAIRKVLTPDQASQYDQMNQNMNQRFGR